MNWIGVNERLPEESEEAKLLLFYEDGTFDKVRFYNGQFEGLFDPFDGIWSHTEGTHWCDVTPPNK
ncbi:DUF551 domain-containing protein [Parapedobacter indicus]|uniref:DUF551 domain-containing protein n=1 Tax=Parapedobacter indicus TaxID=1477437 RepID=A0A1I3V3D3_9SPHI|nr:DUF551 domain-containing protein [Parapedobacter indicus]PPK98987.1 hypothetical protein CLV26_11516 [Parapedobacter indicus]SFJ89453.1 hypothetical protein SAMN05444682_115161 [Parapedobacter indicus]